MRFHAVTLTLAALALAGCSPGVERTLGLTRDSPDEYTVTTRAPLSLPPDFTLRPPEPGAPRPQELSTQRAAEADIAPQTALAGTGGPDTAGQQALLAQAGPPAPADIRDQVDAEAHLDKPSQGFASSLLFWKGKPAPGVVIDPSRESQRLRQDAALGVSPSVGDTPIVKPDKSTGLLQ